MESSQTSFTHQKSRSRRSTKTKPTTEDSTSKNVSPYGRSFQQVLVDSRVFPPHYEHLDGRPTLKLENWDRINERLAQPRPSLSPSRFPLEREYKEFVRLDASAAKEDQVKKNVIPMMQGRIKDPWTASGEIPFTNLAPIIPDENLASGKPDVYSGARPEHLNRLVRDALGHLIIPSTQHDLPILPNHFIAVKDPDGSTAIARRQATYDGHLGARGIHALQNYGWAEPQYDNKAYTFMSPYHSGTLKLYTSHPTQPTNPGDRPEYYINHLGPFAMDNNAETWKDGTTRLGNSMDLA